MDLRRSYYAIFGSCAKLYIRSCIVLFLPRSQSLVQARSSTSLDLQRSFIGLEDRCCDGMQIVKLTGLDYVKYIIIIFKAASPLGARTQ